MQKPAIITFSDSAAGTAARIVEFTGGTVHVCGPEGERGQDLLPKLFAHGTPIIGICAAGILIRILASALFDKHAEPPVLAVSLDGAHVVPLLGGHHGANELAREIASHLGGAAAVTTASDAAFSRALDEPPEGYVLANPQDARHAMAQALNGAAIQLEGQADWLDDAGYPLDDAGDIRVAVTHKHPQSGVLTYHPKSVIAGMGCARGTSGTAIIALLNDGLKQAGVAKASLAAIASIDIKSDEQGLMEAAQHFEVPLRFFSSQELAEEEARLVTPSEVVRKETGTPGVSEAAALKAGTLILPKIKTKDVTCALGLASAPIDLEMFGHPRGEVHVVGIGPGEEIQRTQSATQALQSTTDWVGYGLYLDLIDDLKAEQKEHRFGLGDEEARVRHALELAGQGRKVSLVCSGDAQIYAMGALVHELLDAQGERAVSANAQRVAIVSHPGVSAFQMASARAGALIGHDFCCISLSDLLTPREDILLRLEGAAKSGFVTAFYNPRSKRRTDLLEHAKQVFLAHRPDDCPVIIASNLGRKGENVRTVTLAQFDPSEVDMLTIVLFGAPQSKSYTRSDGTVSVFTPRGYAKKAAKLEVSS